MLWDYGLFGKEARIIRSAARLHDIGKLYIPRYLLFKKDALTEKEWAIIMQHPEIGASMLEGHPHCYCKEIAPLVRYHHERWDGAGYPARLRGAEIPLGARIIAVADSYDAITSQRPYCPARSHEEAMEILRRGTGSQWDPAAVSSIMRVFSSLRPGTLNSELEIWNLDPGTPLAEI
jgi:HD-GYP domain-containing protein (c-di-GMP phosphodiesterase class II)